MASKGGTIHLGPKDRAKLLLELQQSGDIAADVPEAIKQELETAVSENQKQQQQCQTAAVSNSSGDFESNNEHLMKDSFGTGCLCCGEDDDHANLLLCEYCNAEYHTYCCEPPLRQVPTGDWYCSSCKAAIATQQYQQADNDGLDRAICALSPNFTSRFGEIVWAHGGAGFGWWPGFIYDPRLTLGSARDLASKHLGKRHLVFFFECHDAPFAVLTTAKLTKWEEGLMEDYHMGKTAKSAGKVRLQSFQQAMQAATLELAKPIEMRMDWNHSELPQVLPSPQKKKAKPPASINKKRQRKKQVSSEEDTSSDSDNNTKRRHKKRMRNVKGFPLLSSQQNEDVSKPSKHNLTHALNLVDQGRSRRINAIVESPEDGDLFIKLLFKPGGPPVEEENIAEPRNASQNVGFIKLPSRKSNTFAEARSLIEEELVSDGVLRKVAWRFFVPGLGPVSSRQERSIGPIFEFLQQTTLDSNLGDGTTLNPLKVFVVEFQEQQHEYRNSASTAVTVAVTANKANSQPRNDLSQKNPILTMGGVSTRETQGVATETINSTKVMASEPPNDSKSAKSSDKRNAAGKGTTNFSLFDVLSREQLTPLFSVEGADTVLPVSAFPQPSVFDVSAKFPALIIPAKRTNEFRKQLLSTMLHRPRCRVVDEVRSTQDGMPIDEKSLPLVDGERLTPQQCRKIVLDPNQVKSISDNGNIHPLLQPLVSSQQVFLVDHTINFKYEDWTSDELLKRLLEPQGIDEIPSAFEAIGQLAHLNLRPQLLPYKLLIGKILLDKHQPAIRTIVNKVGSIDTKYRTFAMEVIAGYDGPDWSLVTVKEEGCTYQLDFRKVYWNSRLAGEHRRLVRFIRREQRVQSSPLVVGDMMAGIGPFAVPLTANNEDVTIVHANDLNPSSYEYLVANGKKNKCHPSHLLTYNMDARAFCHKLQDEGINVDHFIMNLPASALEFLDSFRGYKVIGSDSTNTLPTIHVHCFASKDKEEADRSIYERAEKALGCKLSDNAVSIHNVRDVAPNKNMYCVSFQVPEAVRKLPRVTVRSEEKGGI